MRLIYRYILSSILPYFGFSWLLLTVILFVQQASRQADIFFSPNIPAALIWQLAFAIIPNVIAFTCPMAALVAVIIGLSRLKGDSELTAIRASGVGNWRVAFPVLSLGLILSALTLFINIYGVPFASQMVRRIALQSAIYKLESPIEIGVFSTEVPNYVIYVKDADKEQGLWKNIFIYSDTNGQTRIVTAELGKIDASGEDSELVLQNASVTTFSPNDIGKKIASENVSDLRFVVQTKRAELINRLSKYDLTIEEMGLAELSAFAASKIGKEKIEADILWFRRIMLSIAPFLFAFLGVGLSLRISRGGRGFGAILALGVLISYYLIALLGEQIVRSGSIPVIIGALLPVVTGFLFGGWLFIANRFSINTNWLSRLITVRDSAAPSKEKGNDRAPAFFSWKTGLLDFDIIRNIIKYFCLTMVFLGAIYIIFTIFELWKYAANIPDGIRLLAKYIFFLLPFIFVQLAPSTLMIAILATFIIKSRQNEIVSWISAGQSAYRLFLPCFFLMALFGGFLWYFQENILPRANLRQDELRSQIKSSGKAVSREGRFWVSEPGRIYSFEIDAANGLPKGFLSFTFDENQKAREMISSERAEYDSGNIRAAGKAFRLSWLGAKVFSESQASSSWIIEEKNNPFIRIISKPSHLKSSEIEKLIAEAESESEKRTYEMALEKRRSLPFLPLIIALFISPFALSLNRRGKVMTIGYAVASWLIFMGITTLFDQYGASGLLSAKQAAWSPLILFSLIGAYLLTKVRT